MREEAATWPARGEEWLSDTALLLGRMLLAGCALAGRLGGCVGVDLAFQQAMLGVLLVVLRGCETLLQRARFAESLPDVSSKQKILGSPGLREDVPAAELLPGRCEARLGDVLEVEQLEGS